MSTLVSDSNPIREEAGSTMYAMPATPLQSMLWGLADGGSADPSWNVAVRFRLSGPLDREVLEASLQRLTDCHEALRTGLALDEGRLVQRFSARATLSVEWCDLRGLEDDAQQQEATRLSNEHARQRLPLGAAPMWRVRLLRLSSGEHWMLWNLSHAVCDGWSVGLLAKDLMREYSDRMAGRETSRESALDYGDYAVWLEAERQTPAYQAHRQYWKNRLRNVKAAASPAHWSNREDAAALPVLQSRLLSRAMTDRLAALAQGCDSTFFHAVLAAFALRIRSEQDSPELIVGTPVSGRDQPELEGIIGTFVNYVPLRLRVEADLPYRDVVRAVREVASQSLEHASYRFEDILADLGQPGAPVQASKLFSSAFICQRDFVHPEISAGLTLTAMPSVSAGALRPLTVFMVERADGWRLSCEVDNRVVSAQAGVKLLEDLEIMMEAAAANPEKAVPSLAQQTQSRGHQSVPGGLAEIRLSGESAQASDVPDAVELDGTGEFALKRVRATEVQHRFWLLDELNPGNASFDLSIRLEMKGPLDAAAFQSAADSLIERNEILRTTFEEEDGQLWQIIHPRGVLDFKYVESEASPSKLNEPGGESSKRFSLQTGPLFRIRLFRIGPETHRLSIDLSHAIADGWSSGLFLEQLRDAYLDLLSGSHTSSRSLPRQFSSYVADERELLTNSETERRIDWWARHLDGSWPPLSLPKDVNQATRHNGQSAAVSCTAIAPSAIISARRIAREANSTLFAVFGAALQSLLARYSGQENILFITPFANRGGDRETVLGPMAMPICLTGRLGSSTTFRDLVGRLGAQSLEAVEHILPFSQVASLLNGNVNADDGHHVLNQIAFFYQRAFVDETQWGSLHVAPLSEFHAATGVEWQLGVIERKKGFSAEFLYSPAQYSEETMSLVGAHYTRLLTAALSNPDVPVSQLNILTPGELAAKVEHLPILPVTQKLLNPSSPAETSELAAAVSPAEPAVPRISAADSGAGALSYSEREMVRLWQSLFRNEQIELDSNFFDLGGHSLLMARLQIALKKEFDVQLTVADVFRYPTVQELAAWLDRTRNEGKRTSSAISNPRIIPIQPHGSATPIFVISQSMIFRGLAAALGEDQPLYALQMLDEDITPDMAAADFAKLTEFYIQLIRQVQPQGPYRLAGWCVSGWIGYGIARRLEREGEEIDLLMIMDAWAPGYWIKRSFARRTLMRAVYRFQRLRWVGRRLLKASREERSLYIRRSLHGTAAAAARNIAVWLHRMDLPVQVRLTEEMRPSEQLEYTATRSFDTGALDGKVLIFRSEEQSRGPLLAEDMGWSELLGRSITVEQLPGDHQEIFNHAGAQMMARAARRILRDPPAEVDSGGGGDAVPSPA